MGSVSTLDIAFGHPWWLPVGRTSQRTNERARQCCLCHILEAR